MNSKIKDRGVDLLFQAVLSLKIIKKCYDFFEGLCTVPEIRAMSQRLTVAHMLHSKYVYSDIIVKTGASTTTISHVNRSLNYGCDGYKIVFKRLEESGDTKQWALTPPPHSIMMGLRKMPITQGGQSISAGS